MEGIGYSSPEGTTLTKIYDLPNSRMLNSMVQSKFNLEVKFFGNVFMKVGLFCFETGLNGTFLKEVSLNLLAMFCFDFLAVSKFTPSLQCS